jgi:hypothetical protein
MQHLYLLPVLFTTARLWTCDVDLRTSDLQTGHIDVSKYPLIERQWLLFNYNQSPALKHDHQITNEEKSYFSEYRYSSATLSDVVIMEFSRTIAIVNATGIFDFLRWLNVQPLR